MNFINNRNSLVRFRSLKRLRWASLNALLLLTTIGSVLPAFCAELRWSAFNDRSSAAPLNGAIIEGEVYLFIGEDAGITQVEFTLDPPGDLPPAVEQLSPYDFAGTLNNGRAEPTDSATLADGTHKLEAVVTFTDNTSEVLSATFEVANEPPTGNTAELQFSTMPTRTPAQMLAGATVTGQIYAFLSEPPANTDAVEFFIDAMDNTPDQVELYAPYDLAGGNELAAWPFDTATLSPGPHTIYAVTSANGVKQVVQAEFHVANDAIARLSLSRDDLRFAQREGSTAPGQIITITASDAANVDFTTHYSAGWLAVEPSGTTPITVGFFPVYADWFPGEYTTEVEFRAPGYASAYATVNLTVYEWSEMPYTLLVSRNAQRTDAQPLRNATLDAYASAYVFVSPADDIEQVEFGLSRGADFPSRVERVAPFDFAGTANDAAKSALPWYLSGISPGQNQLRAVITKADGTLLALSSYFDVLYPVEPSVEVMPNAIELQLNSGERSRVGVTVEDGSHDGSLPVLAISIDQPWLDTTATGEAAPTFFVEIDASTLNPGRFSGEVTVTPSGGIPARIPVTLDVSAANTPQCLWTVCPQPFVEPPYELDFATDHGQLPAGNGIGTGFTHYQTNADTAAWLPENIAIDLDAGALQLTTTSGIQYLDINSGVNVLGVGVNAFNQVTQISTSLLKPQAVPTTGNYEQAGLWFGIDQDSFIKLVFISGPGNELALQMATEVDASTVDEVIYSIHPGDADVRLRLVANALTGVVTGLYAIGNEPFQVLGSYSPPTMFFEWIANPLIGPRSFAGIFATHRNGPSPLQFEFGSFAVEELSEPE